MGTNYVKHGIYVFTNLVSSLMTHLTPNQQLQILNLYKGQPISKAERALDIMEAYQAEKANKSLRLRLAIVGLSIGD